MSLLGASWYEHARCGSNPCACTPEELAAEAEEERLKLVAIRAMTAADWARSIVIPADLLKGAKP